MMGWQKQLNEMLSELHPVQIQEGIIEPAIEQIIDDYEDCLRDGFYDKEEEKDQIEMTKRIIKKLKTALKILKDV